MADNMRNKTLSGLIWRYAEQWAAQGVSFVVGIVLARLMMPEAYGLLSLITVFISISSVFTMSGLTGALIQRKHTDNIDFSTVFYYSLGFSILLYGILFCSAPLIARFYAELQLVPVIRVLSLTLIIGAVNSVQQAYVRKTMQFKRFFWATLWGTIISGLVGILMAYKGMGVWALVAQQLTNQVIDTVVLWFTVKWRPQLIFSLRRMKKMFGYSWKLFCSNLLDTVYNNAYSLTIGKVYSSEDLAYYNRGGNFPSLVVTNINSSIDSVLFPVMSEVQDEKARLKAMVRRSIVTTTFLIFPCMAGLAAIAEPLTLLLLTEKWLPSVPFMRFCCFTYAFLPVTIANLQAIKAVGRSDVFLKLEIIKKVVGIATLLITLPLGIYAMMIGRCVSSVICTFANAFPNKKLLGYSYFEQMKDILPSLALSLVMMVAVLGIGFLPFHPLLVMVIQILFGVMLYIGLAKIFKMECFKYILNTVKDILFGRRKQKKIEASNETRNDCGL